MRRRRRSGQIQRVEEFLRARWYLARGYAPSAVAALVGVHRNTVLNWSRTFGYVVRAPETRTINAIIRRVRRLSLEGQEAVVKALGGAIG